MTPNELLAYHQTVREHVSRLPWSDRWVTKDPGTCIPGVAPWDHTPGARRAQYAHQMHRTTWLRYHRNLVVARLFNPEGD